MLHRNGNSTEMPLRLGRKGYCRATTGAGHGGLFLQNKGLEYNEKIYEAKSDRSTNGAGNRDDICSRLRAGRGSC